MRQLGLKKILLLSVIGLVGISVSISSFVLFMHEKAALTESIVRENTSYVKAEAKVIETRINEKVEGVSKLAEQYRSKAIEGTEQEFIERTSFLANAMNLNSAVLAFETGDAYWNQAGGSWPNHKFNGDVRESSWYQAGRNASDVTVTNPYTEDGENWITIIEKIKGGTISVDMKLDFLGEMVKQSINMPGADIAIMNHDTTILASSSPVIKAGEKAVNSLYFSDLAVKVMNKESAVIDYVVNDQNQILFSQRINAGDKHWYFMVGLNKPTAFACLDESRNSAILVVILAISVSAAVAFTLIQVIYRPILSLRETIDDLSSGSRDLTQRLKVESNDDIGHISKGINRFIENLQSMMMEIKSAAAALQTNVVNMREQSERNSVIVQNHVQETEQVVTAIEEMSVTADSMATDAANTANLIQQANQTSVESRQTVKQSQQTVSDLIAEVEQAAADVQKMNDETQNIGAILNVIGEIAEQTNLLALNAAIEAARAGEQGRGFAVVADEVRNLASRTKDSTEEIETALNSLLKGSQLVVNSMDNTKNRCQEAANGSGEVAESLKVMTNFVDELNNLSSQIATAAEEQSSVTQEVSRNMSAINGIVSELDTNGQQALKGAEEIAGLNEKLNGVVNRFKL
jgi:methyl-accepting chemotaxis protein